MRKDYEVDPKNYWFLIVMGMGLLMFVIIMMLCCSCSKMPFDYINDYMGWKDDNEIEQLTEEVIKLETGLNVDLSKEDSK